MKNILLSLAAIMIAATSYAQVQVHTVQKPKSDVSSQSYESKVTVDGYSFKYLADGRKGRAAFNVGEGVPVKRVYNDLPLGLGDFRLVPLVTLDASAPSSAPRTTFALLAPEVQVVNGVKFQVGLAGAGFNTRDWSSVNGVQTFVGLKVNFKDVSKTLGLSKALGL